MVKEIRIDGVIGTGPGEVSADMIRQQLPTNNGPIRVSIHSEGGSVFEGFAIYDMFANYSGPKTIAVESTAFSIASYIAMAFDDIEISPNGYFMFHNPKLGVKGDDDELSAGADVIGKLKASMIEAYAKRSGKSEEEIKAILKAETYYNATEAVANGFASRITGKPVQARAFARLDNLPHGVVAALFGAGFGGDNRETTREKSMSESQPVAATIAEIKAAFPKAKAEFVLNCIEQKLPLASVATVAVKEMMAENDAMAAKIAALEEEIASAKAKAMEEEEAKAKAKAKAEEEEEAKAKATARRTGVRPIAQASGNGTPTATAQWNGAIHDALAATNGDRAKAVALANRSNPGLREAYLAEVNAR